MEKYKKCPQCGSDIHIVAHKCKFCGEAIAKDKKDRQVMPEKWLYEYFLPLYPHVSNLVPTYGEITHTPEGYKYISFIQEKSFL